ncbi:molybdopterin-dependent oxidoreductase [Epibacterium ulvae]|uniref:molybdopterin-dependent oxidoreductase n=1 Tax=Epibacterium ulvae TaxID=1156985 RepID=UPI0024902F77|nr:molybdopterin-dependent oxidoreductase [Epibacterium ulvae]
MIAVLKRMVMIVAIAFAGVGGAHAGATLLQVDVLNDDGSLRESHSYTLDDLRAVSAEGFETNTIWTEGVQQFKGVALSTLLEQLNVSGGQLQAVAINDYSVTIPITDAIAGGPIVAYERNGASMSVRNKGPLWIVYPYDRDPSYQTEAVYSRSIWQLEKIIVSK